MTSWARATRWSGSRAALCLLRAPLPVEDRVDELALPLALDPLVLDEVRLAPQAELFEHPRRRGVPRLQPANHPVQAEAVEGDTEERPRRLGREAMAAVRGMRDVADLAERMLLARPGQDHVGDDGSGLLLLGREREHVPLGPE